MLRSNRARSALEGSMTTSGIRRLRRNPGRMPKWAGALLAILVAAPAAAQESKTSSVAIGYAIARYLEHPAGYAPFGLYACLASTRQPLGFEVEAAYHRDPRGPSVLNSLTAGVGPRWVVDHGDNKLYAHALAGVRYDRLMGESNSAFGGVLGGGAEFPFGSDVNFRLGGDVQIFFDEGESLKSLRLIGALIF